MTLIMEPNPISSISNGDVSMNKAFGSNDRYYSQKTVWEKAEESDIHTFLDEHLQKDAEQIVTQTYEQWNQLLRNYIRSETGLKLSVGGQHTSVPVKIKGSLPLSFRRVFEFNDPETELWELMTNRPILEKTRVGLGLARRNTTIIKYFLSQNDGDDYELKCSLEKSEDFIDRALKMLATENPILEKIRRIDEDILGSYFFRIPEIHIYWKVIAFLAPSLNVPIEDLALITLAHEIAHAYTHLGRDIDGDQWDTESFADSDIRIVEGLAQFYTETICRGLAKRKPTVSETFRTFVKDLEEPYRVHSRWFDNSSNQNRTFKEVVRYAMVNCRKNGTTDYGFFCKTISDTKQRIGKPS